MKIYEIGTGYTPIPAQIAAATECIVEELTKTFIKMGQPVQIIDISAEDRANNDLPIEEVKVPAVFTKSDVRLGLVHKMKRVVYSVALALKLKKILKAETEKPVFHFHNQYNLFFFCKLTSKKIRAKAVVVYTNHNGMWSLPWEQAEGTLRKKYFQEVSAMKKADIVFVLNFKMKDNIVQNLGIPEERVVLINNGVNTAMYSPVSDEKANQTKAKYGLADKKIILQVGSIYENKGQGRTLEWLAPVLKQNQDLVFAFIGGIVSQEYYDEVMAKVEELGISSQVLYLGTVSPGEEMNDVYNMAYATTFASKYEGFPLVLIESLSAGVPAMICSQSINGFENGSICVDPQNITDEFQKLLLDEVYHKNLKKVARDTAISTYSWETIAKDYLRSFKQF